jgi:hypothetical protein
MKEKLELRMYGLVNYQLTGIQKGIQFGHAVVEYGNKYFNTDLYQDWSKNWKTFIILNGGTTNKRMNDYKMPIGTLNNHLINLAYNNIDFASFEEIDLGDQLTAVVFIVDERVFDRKKYPDFNKYVEKFYIDSKYVDYDEWSTSNDSDKISIANEWKNFIGGDKNLFLRNFVFKFNLA